MDKDEIQKLVNRVSHIYSIYSAIIGILGAGAFLCFMHWEINTSLLVVTSGALLTFIGIFYSLTILPGEEEKNQLFLKLMDEIKRDIEVFFNDVNKRTPIEYALKRVKIRRLYIDRGFFDSDSIELFKYYHLKFLMPCTANERIKKILEVVPSPTVIKDYEMKNTLFNVIVVNDEEGTKRAFATNIDFNENDVGLAERLFNLYSKRWGIETSYRVKKHSFRPKTTSKNYFIRLFYFMFSVLLYNLWLLADILVCLAVLGVFKGDHIITSKYFCSILVSVDPGG